MRLISYSIKNYPPTPTNVKYNLAKHVFPVCVGRFCVIFLLFICSGLFAQNSHWADPVFIEGGVQYYIAPKILSDYIKVSPGFRGALGYEWRRFRFSAESGYTHVTGTNPLVLDLKAVPLLFKAGYTFPLVSGLGIKPELGLGLLFSETDHYETALDMLQDIFEKSPVTSLFASARIHLIWTFPGNALSLYAGGGTDLILETGGPIPLPVIDAGLTIKPFALFNRTKKQSTTTSAETAEKAGENLQDDSKPEENAAPAIRFEATKENIVIENSPDQGKIVRLLNAVYFQANSVTLIEKYRYILDSAGEQLRAVPAARLILRAYSAPTGTHEGQIAVAGGRALFCEEYLSGQYGISKDRISIEWYGADKAPEWGNASLESYRCVELIISG
jgi:outer membrane protein OmpA-like peptidoglycan-associated protein